MANLHEKCKNLEERLVEQQLKTTTLATNNAKDVSDPIRSRDEEEIRRLQFELVRLTTELTSAQSQVSSMERRLDGALRGRLRYKDLWTRALQEVTQLRQEAANATKQELQRREAEVEGLRREQSLFLRDGDTHASLLYKSKGQHNHADSSRLDSGKSPLPFTKYYTVSEVYISVSLLSNLPFQNRL